MRSIATRVALVAAAVLSQDVGAARGDTFQLPRTLPGAVAGEPAAPSRPWTIRDIVEIRRIEEVAVDERSGQIAFLLKQGDVASGELRYAVYVVDDRTGSAPRKLVEAPFMQELSWHPGSDAWSVRADFGDAVQLYDIDSAGKPHPLVVNRDTASVGGHDGIVRSALDQPRETGVLAYQWAPDGSGLWYVKVRLQTAQQRKASADSGIVYDDSTMTFFNMRRSDNPYLGKELRLFDPRSGADRLLAFAPANGLDDLSAFYPAPGYTEWLPDSQRVRYMIRSAKKTGEREFETTTVDTRSGRASVESVKSIYDSVASAVIGADGRTLTIEQRDDGQELFERDATGKQLRDLGQVPYRRFSIDRRVWLDEAASSAVLAVHYRDHDGLVSYPASASGARLAAVDGSLSHCAFSRDLGHGACVLESLTLAPQLVAVSARSGETRVLARPNAAYDGIRPLRSERMLWTNRYGNVSDGYVTYPRDYVPGRRYPAIVVTHGGDAQNLFAAIGFQAECPVQVLAEQGYLVLSVNDPWLTSKTRAASEAFNTGHGDVGVEAQQFTEAFDAVASMEAALQSVIDKGMADPARTGIWGYSRGGALMEWTMSQSRMFKAAAGGDCAGWDAGVYWMFGLDYRALYKGIYGGSPYDLKALEQYRKLSPSVRAAEFAGPLLEQCTAAGATVALEIHTMLQDAGIPSELVFFPDESHIFWHPGHRAHAMQRILDWYDYWLRDLRTPDPDKQAQYERWDKMAQIWKAGAAASR